MQIKLCDKNVKYVRLVRSAPFFDPPAILNQNESLYMKASNVYILRVRSETKLRIVRLTNNLLNKRNKTTRKN